MSESRPRLNHPLKGRAYLELSRHQDNPPLRPNDCQCPPLTQWESTTSRKASDKCKSTPQKKGGFEHSLRMVSEEIGIAESRSKAYLEAGYFVYGNCKKADFSNKNLAGADCRNANLRYSNLSNSNLSEANLKGADLTGAILRGAILRGADLRGAKLTRADFEDADLSDADLRFVILNGTNLNLSGVRTS